VLSSKNFFKRDSNFDILLDSLFIKGEDHCIVLYPCKTHLTDIS